jgi:arylsulfatase A-like enzyme
MSLSALMVALLSATSPAAAAVTTTRVAAGDSQVNSGNPGVAYGTVQKIAVCNACALSGAPTKRGYVKFDVSNLPGTVTSATLRVYATTTPVPVITARTVPASWSEATITWTNAPAPGAAVGSSVAASAVGYVDIPLSSVGTGAFALTTASTTVLRLASRETATPPVLIVVTDAVPPSTTTSPTTPPTTTIAPPTGRPNVLLVNMDDARFDALNYMPKTSQWLSSGVNYPNSYVTIPSCCPSRSTLFTGRYSHNNGIRLQGDGLLLDKDFTLANYLDTAGYQTAMAGKFLLSWPDATAPPNFDKHTIIKGGYTNYNARVEGVSRRVAEYSTTFLGSSLRGYVRGFESNDAAPWFAYFAPQAPHIVGGWKSLAVPEAKYASAAVGNCVQTGEPDKSDKPPHMSWVTPDPAYVKSLCESQARTLMSVDDQIDLMLTQLTADGELANTIVIVTSDNGHMWGDHDRWEKFVAYEPSVRVPLRIRWDGRLTAGTDQRRTETVDLLPTILQAAGITPRKTLDGKSLLAPNTRTDTFAEYFYDNAANGPTPSWASLSNGARKYIETYDTAGNVTFREYYRLATDPLELTNVLRDGSTANDPPAAELTQLGQQLAAARTCSGTQCP